MTQEAGAHRPPAGVGFRQRIYARSLYAFKDRGVWLVPAFQIEGRTIVPGLDVVVPAQGHRDSLL